MIDQPAPSGVTGSRSRGAAGKMQGSGAPSHVRRDGRRAAALALGAALATGAVAAPAPAPPPPDALVARARLADLAARAERWREPAAVTIGDTTRYVLGPSDVLAAEVRAVGDRTRSDAAGRLEVEIRCPSEVAGPHHVVVDLVKFAVPPEQFTRRLGPACEGKAGVWQRFAFDDLPPKAIFQVTATVTRAPPATVESPVVTVPARAELRLALGLRAEGTPPTQPIDVHVTAVAPDGARRPLGTRALSAADAEPPGGWVDWRLPLDAARAALGPEMRFVFEGASRTERNGLLHVLWGDPAVWGPPPADRPAHVRNLVLVSIDTLRADRLGVAGYPLDVTPNLDRFARQGTMFTDAVTSATWTKPAHATMLTGTLPCVNDVDWGGPAINGPLPAGIVPLAERLRMAGWATAAFTEDAYVTPDVFQRGFDLFVANYESHVSGAVEETVAAATAWIRDNVQRPFFVFVHTYQVHHPYTPPEAYSAIAHTRPMPALPGLPPPAKDAMADAAAYLAEIAFTDSVVGRLFDTIDTLGLRDDTVVVVTADHGEAFGEHGRRFHGTGLQREQLRVPLLVRAPGLVAPGRRVDDLVGLVDLTPTLLELLGQARAPWMQGISLAGVMRPGSEERVLLGRAFPIRGFGKLHGVRGATWKLDLSSKPHYFDLRKDPGELHPFRVSKQTIAVLTGAVDSGCRRARERVAAAAAAAAVRARQAGTPSAAEQMKLRALGYLE